MTFIIFNHYFFCENLYSLFESLTYFALELCRISNIEK